jgi:hypothetical protein
LESSDARIPSQPAPDAAAGAGPVFPPNITPATYKDRSTALIVCGIIEILGGALCSLAIPFLFLSAMLTRKVAGGGVPLRSLPASVLTYSIMAAVLMTLGIGAIQAKRWARALNLILSWISLVMGILVTGMLIVVLPTSLRIGMQAAHHQDSPEVSTGIMAAILTFMIVFLAIFFIAVPLAFLLFYRTKNVEETCRHRDPVERWTDRRPLPIIAMALLVVFGGLYSLVVGISTPVFPFFGRYLAGIPGVIVFILFAGIEAYIAVLFFRMRVAGWWLALAAWTFRLASTVVTYAHGNFPELYSKMGWSQAQMDTLQRNPMFRSGAFLWMGPLFMMVYFGFLLWLKRYFHSPAPAGYTAPQSSIVAVSRPEV